MVGLLIVITGRLSCRVAEKVPRVVVFHEAVIRMERLTTPYGWLDASTEKLYFPPPRLVKFPAGIFVKFVPSQLYA